MDIYSEIILDHYKNPRNKGSVKNATATAIEHNPLCGDKIKIELLLDKSNRIKTIKFSGSGCAISQAAASMLLETLTGKTLNEIEKIKSREIIKMLNIPISPAREKCALLGLYAVKKAVELAAKPRNSKKRSK
ncbi:SUF system NifU family Fe-S cluster assembly protein [Candidatus Peregrinibacteria bacterium RIFCSPLOWO2_01_FULL_39_12]|nr:MAG: SUF system NifU family Fe-S cluster assembly protein [Candidatus Peregrinibacteria bacterium RIFCSPLOWO2_02_FULL_39_10]OGJ42934.1 MAG: SUF system NifU family Fe-S cluster assembly protein [Candidatus Peregrinibacteria bacterium RIFCSPLOWO2_01_FULL_39_12]